MSFYKHDIERWRGGTASLSHEQYRVYHVIVEQIMLDEGPIKIHERMLAGAANMSVRAFNRTLAELVALGKLRFQDGRLTNSRAETELGSIKNNRENAKTGGISSGKARREARNATTNHNENNGAAEAPLPGAMKPKREEKRREEKEREANASPKKADDLFEAPQAGGANGSGAIHPKRSKALTPLPDDFEPNNADLACFAEHGITAPTEQAKVIARWRYHHTAKGTTYKDWHASLRYWVSSPLQERQTGPPKSGQQRWAI